MRILCNSPRCRMQGEICIACKDAFQTNGGNYCCTMAEEQEFDLDMILKECEYAEQEKEV